MNEKNTNLSKFSIGITTFSKRFDMLNTLVKQIRKYNNLKIIICVNGEKNGNFNEEYRKKVLNLCLTYENIYPIFFIEIRGLSKMWNTIVNTSVEENILLLNDDLQLLSSDLFEQLDLFISNNDNKITRINNSFSHFLVNKKFIDEIGYFDERLIGFGEEDGDIYYRLIKKGLNLNNLFVNGLVNLVDDSRHEDVQKGIGKYSKFNREYIYNKKYSTEFSSPFRGMFDTPMRQVIKDINCYPLEKFFQDNKDKL